MKLIDNYLELVTPDFDPPLELGDFILYRRAGIIKAWTRRPRIGLIKGVTDDGMHVDVDYPTRAGGMPEIVSIFQIVQHFPMEDMNYDEGDSDLPE